MCAAPECSGISTCANTPGYLSSLPCSCSRASPRMQQRRQAALRINTAASSAARAAAAATSEEYEDWRGSHHDLAMQEATGRTRYWEISTMRTFTYHGVTTRFYRDGEQLHGAHRRRGRQAHRLPGAPTCSASTRCSSTCCPCPGAACRRLSVAWDSAGPEEQAWPTLVSPVSRRGRSTTSDPLHWTGPYQNWNTRCAECHSDRPAQELRCPERAPSTTTFRGDQRGLRSLPRAR